MALDFFEKKLVDILSSSKNVGWPKYNFYTIVLFLIIKENNALYPIFSLYFGIYISYTRRVVLNIDPDTEKNAKSVLILEKWEDPQRVHWWHTFMLTGYSVILFI